MLPPPPPGLSRRGFLGLVVAGVAAACTSGSGEGGTAAPTTGRPAPLAVPPAPDGLTGDPFTLGVASGDPRPDSVILWTRLAPDPLSGGGMPEGPAELLWEVGTDDSFGEVVASGIVTAEEAFGYSVHVDAGGLTPDTWYAYRFRIGDHTSPAGRTRTTPAAGAMPAGDRMLVGFGSCQSWQSGYYTAYPHLVDERLDLMLFLGDYIYEGAANDSALRSHNGPEIFTLEDYRNRYALYKGDPNLQAAHAACPWVVTWDDHEVDNDYAADLSEKGDPPAEFDERRAAGYQAFYEHHPVRIDPPDGPALDLYRSVEFGALATIFVLDGRQYRSDQPCSEVGSPSFGTSCGEEDDPQVTMLGAAQKTWLVDGLRDSDAVWDVLANQTVMTHMPIAGVVFNFDQWDGYTTERTEILETAAERPDGNLVVVTGDIHAFGVGDLQASEDGPVVGTEFVGGAISSTFPADFAPLVEDSIGALEQIRYANLTANGYGVLELTPERCTGRLRAVSTTKETTAEIRTLTTWVVEAGTPGATEA